MVRFVVRESLWILKVAFFPLGPIARIDCDHNSKRCCILLEFDTLLARGNDPENMGSTPGTLNAGA